MAPPSIPRSDATRAWRAKIESCTKASPKPPFSTTRQPAVTAFQPASLALRASQDRHFVLGGRSACLVRSAPRAHLGGSERCGRNEDAYRARLQGRNGWLAHGASDARATGCGNCVQRREQMAVLPMYRSLDNFTTQPSGMEYCPCTKLLAQTALSKSFNAPANEELHALWYSSQVGSASRNWWNRHLSSLPPAHAVF